MRQRPGKSTSPLSACNSPRSSANRLDLPEPFGPIRPILSPGLRETSAPSSNTFVPRRSVTSERRIMGDHGARGAFYRSQVAGRAGEREGGRAGEREGGRAEILPISSSHG